MNDPKRLLEADGSSATSFERQLLQSVVDEQPSAEVSRRMLEATLASGGGAAAASGAAGLSVSPWMIAGLLAVGAAGGWLVLSTPRSAGEPRASVSQHPPALPAPELAKSARDDVSAADGVGDGASEPAEAPRQMLSGPSSRAERSLPTVSTPEGDGEAKATLRAAPRPKAPQTGVAPTAVAQTGAAQTAERRSAEAAPSLSVDVSSTLRDEVRLLDEARAALQAGNASAAQKALSVYEQRFPAGMLRQEALVLGRRARELGRSNAEPGQP